MVVSRRPDVLAQCVNCGHEIAEMYSPSPRTAWLIAKAKEEQERNDNRHREGAAKRRKTIAARFLKG